MQKHSDNDEHSALDQQANDDDETKFRDGCAEFGNLKNRKIRKIRKIRKRKQWENAEHSALERMQKHDEAEFRDVGGRNLTPGPQR